MSRRRLQICGIVGLWSLILCVSVAAQSPDKHQHRGGGTEPPAEGVTPPPGYVIGADDLLAINFWGDKQLSIDVVVVRPDGMISLPLLNDIQAAGFTPVGLAEILKQAASKFVTEPDVTVIVKEIRSRKVFVLGQGIAKPGIVGLNTDLNVLQVLAASGGLLEYADKGGIVILRTENGRERRFKFNFDEVVKGKNAQQNILLKPGDTVLVN